MIGLSVTRCILAVVRREARLEDIEKIIGGTCVRTREGWEAVIKENAEVSWRPKEVCDHAAEILYQLLNEGKIEQPRFNGEDDPLAVASYDFNVKGIIWVENESELLAQCEEPA